MVLAVLVLGALEALNGAWERSSVLADGVGKGGTRTLHNVHGGAVLAICVLPGAHSGVAFEVHEGSVRELG
jgi:hypothetical protein